MSKGDGGVFNLIYKGVISHWSLVLSDAVGAASRREVLVISLRYKSFWYIPRPWRCPEPFDKLRVTLAVRAASRREGWAKKN